MATLYWQVFLSATTTQSCTCVLCGFTKSAIRGCLREYPFDRNHHQSLELRYNLTSSYDNTGTKVSRHIDCIDRHHHCNRRASTRRKCKDAIPKEFGFVLPLTVYWLTIQLAIGWLTMPTSEPVCVATAMLSNWCMSRLKLSWCTLQWLATSFDFCLWTWILVPFTWVHFIWVHWQWTHAFDEICRWRHSGIIK